MDKEVAQQIARQLARPSGDGGVKMTTAMNRTNAFMTARALEALEVAAGERLLEIGPGNGRLSVDAVRRLGPDGAYLGFEYEADIAALARSALIETGVPVDIRSGDFMGHEPEEHAVDALLAVNVLYFFADLGRFVERCCQWLRPGGRAAIAIRSTAALRAMPFVEYGFHLRPLDDVMRALKCGGFESIEARFFDEGTTTLGDFTVEVDSIIVRASLPS